MDDSVWDSGESGKLTGTCSLLEGAVNDGWIVGVYLASEGINASQVNGEVFFVLGRIIVFFFATFAMKNE